MGCSFSRMPVHDHDFSGRCKGNRYEEARVGGSTRLAQAVATRGRGKSSGDDVWGMVPHDQNFTATDAVLDLADSSLSGIRLSGSITTSNWRTLPLRGRVSQITSAQPCSTGRMSGISWSSWGWRHSAHLHSPSGGDPRRSSGRRRSGRARRIGRPARTTCPPHDFGRRVGTVIRCTAGADCRGTRRVPVRRRDRLCRRRIRRCLRGRS